MGLSSWLLRSAGRGEGPPVARRFWVGVPPGRGILAFSLGSGICRDSSIGTVGSTRPDAANDADPGVSGLWSSSMRRKIFIPCAPPCENPVRNRESAPLSITRASVVAHWSFRVHYRVDPRRGIAPSPSRLRALQSHPPMASCGRDRGASAVGLAGPGSAQGHPVVVSAMRPSPRRVPEDARSAFSRVSAQTEQTRMTEWCPYWEPTAPDVCLGSRTPCLIPLSRNQRPPAARHAYTFRA